MGVRRSPRFLQSFEQRWRDRGALILSLSGCACLDAFCCSQGLRRRPYELDTLSTCLLREGSVYIAFCVMVCQICHSFLFLFFHGFFLFLSSQILERIPYSLGKLSSGSLPIFVCFSSSPFSSSLHSTASRVCTP